MPNRDPYIATAIRKEIAAKSQLEVDSLNRFLDNTIAIIDENNALYDEQMKQVLLVREGVEDVRDFFNNLKEKKIKAKKLAETADNAVKAQEVVEKVNTISMSLNPVAAALQFAAKILKTELEHELNGLKDTAAIIDPAIDNFTRFYGGVLRAAPNETVVGDLNRKIKDLEDRIAARKKARTDRRTALGERQGKRDDKLKAARLEVKEHNDAVRAKQEADAQILNNSPEKVGTEGQSTPDATTTDAPGPGEQTLTETATQGPTTTPTVELLENAPIETVTAVVESTETGIPQGGLENADDTLVNIDDDGDGVVTVDEVFDALVPDESFIGPMLP